MSLVQIIAIRSALIQKEVLNAVVEEALPYKTIIIAKVRKLTHTLALIR